MKIVIADAHQLVRDGIAAILKPAGFLVIGVARTGYQVVDVASRCHPDVVLVDAFLPELNGVEATRRLKTTLGDVRVLGLSTHGDRGTLFRMLAAGADGYLLKDSASEELVQAIHAVARGEKYLSRELAEQPGASHFARLPNQTLGPSSTAHLTPRERQVLQLLAEGWSSKEIGRKLNVALPTVETHRRQITEKLGLRGVAQLTKWAIREGLTSLD